MLPPTPTPPPPPPVGSRRRGSSGPVAGSMTARREFAAVAPFVTPCVLASVVVMAGRPLCSRLPISPFVLPFVGCRGEKKRKKVGRPAPSCPSLSLISFWGPSLLLKWGWGARLTQPHSLARTCWALGIGHWTASGSDAGTHPRTLAPSHPYRSALTGYAALASGLAAISRPLQNSLYPPSLPFTTLAGCPTLQYSKIFCPVAHLNFNDTT